MARDVSDYHHVDIKKNERDEYGGNFHNCMMLLRVVILSNNILNSYLQFFDCLSILPLFLCVCFFVFLIAHYACGCNVRTLEECKL